MVTRAEMEAFVRESLSKPARCRPDYPHEGRLRYTRGNPGYYVCECGARYLKDGKGGMMVDPAFGE